MLDVNGQARIRTITVGNITTDNIIVANSNGVLKKLPVSLFRSIVTPVVTGGHTIATHTPRTGTGTTDIQETVTSINNTITGGHQIATYAGEDGGTPTPINETVTSLTQETPTPIADPTTNNTAGDITYTRENGTTQTANVVSSNANNSIRVGTDGGGICNHYLR